MACHAVLNQKSISMLLNRTGGKTPKNDKSVTILHSALVKSCDVAKHKRFCEYQVELLMYTSRSQANIS